VPREAIDAGVGAPPIDAAPEPSQLPAQIALYEAARDAAARNELAHAIDLLDQLLRDYPTTQLRADAELTRAELLARADRGDAVAALQGLIADPAHAGRAAELLRTLGDLHRRRGDCTHAIDAYTRALAAHPGERDRKAAEAGRDSCTRK
jgi:predicted negative regulator of RcsB-dependent stress response